MTIKILIKISGEIYKLTLKSFGNGKDVEHPDNLEKNYKVKGHILLDCKTYYGATIIKTP